MNRLKYGEAPLAPWLAYLQSSKHRYREVVSSIPFSSEPIALLDIGTTPFTLFIKQVYPHYKVSTLDLTEYMEPRCKAMGIQFKTCDLDKVHIPFDDSCFDVVVFCEVLEHLFVPPTNILNEIRRIMRPEGKLVLSVPNIAALYQRIRLLFGISPLPNADDQMAKGLHVPHIHEYTMS